MGIAREALRRRGDDRPRQRLQREARRVRKGRWARGIPKGRRRRGGHGLRAFQGVQEQNGRVLHTRTLEDREGAAVRRRLQTLEAGRRETRNVRRKGAGGTPVGNMRECVADRRGNDDVTRPLERYVLSHPVGVGWIRFRLGDSNHATVASTFRPFVLLPKYSMQPLPLT